MESLPQHLLEEILLRVPVKSMICFRCVKKSWHTLFQDLTFITKHFRHHLSYKRPSRLIRCDRNKNMRCILYMVKKLCGPSTNTLLRFHFDDDLDDGGFVFFIEGFSMYFDRIDICVCFNGIICLGHSSVGFVLWNSEIKEFKDVPAPPSPNVGYHKSTCAFGYNHYSNEFKVVSIYTKFQRHTGLLSPSIQIYNESTGYWRQIDTLFDQSVICFPGYYNELFFNGVYHWTGCILMDERGQHLEAIISFDMREEVFRTIKMPDFGDLSHSNYFGKTLGVLGDCIALIIYDKRVIEKNFEIWVLREYGVKESWTNLYKIGPISVIQRGQKLLMKDWLYLVGNKLLILKDRGRLLLFDFVAQELKNYHLRNPPDSFSLLQVMDYEDY